MRAIDKDLPMVRKRQIFHIAGYDPVTPGDHYQRFVRQIEIFKRTWGVNATVSKPNDSSGCLAWTVDVSGANWQVQSYYELWSWDDIVQANALRSPHSRILMAVVTYADLLFSGTLYRYFKANVRYFLFAIVPPLELSLFGALAGLAGWCVGVALGLGGSASSAATIIVGLVVFFLLLLWPGRRWRVQQVLDDWIFSRDYICGRRVDMEVRLDRFAVLLVQRMKEHKVDEIILVGHSLGALFAAEIVARAFARNGDLGRHGVPLGMVTLGATIPKCTLHPEAGRIRERISQTVKMRSVHWVEFQCRRDAISFYKFDPISLCKISKEQLDRKPIIRHVRMSSMLTPETFARYRLRILRLHYQFVMANERRAMYDYFMMGCGPLQFARWTLAPGGLLDYINIDGTVTASERSEIKN